MKVTTPLSLGIICMGEAGLIIIIMIFRFSTAKAFYYAVIAD